jgi:hypothetical protein
MSFAHHSRQQHCRKQQRQPDQPNRRLLAGRVVGLRLLGHGAVTSKAAAHAVRITDPTHESNAGRSGGVPLSFGQPSSATRPISVILIRTMSIPVTTSRSAVASPARTRPVIMLRSNPWARTSSSFVMPSGKLASSASTPRCSLLRLGSRGGTAIDTPVSDSLASDRRLGDTGYKKHL